MKYFDKFIFYQIIEFLSNTDLLTFFLINHFVNSISYDKYIQSYLFIRPHPIVFNLIDNYCVVCNKAKPYLYYSYGISKCNHIKFR